MTEAGTAATATPTIVTTRGTTIKNKQVPGRLFIRVSHSACPLSRAQARADLPILEKEMVGRRYATRQKKEESKDKR